ncbi:TonB-dependent receptor [Fulvivirgaceae bacterium BMA12]|uniref:TonB-dependent receptor n=1 Tax=Agaribacillus aureus TaxID=3051825 RepID=A0ABT8L0R7_9BACT|nr:TonB-dependent receptor [Fulvivirgaceae bacterium BMA12]
MKPLNHSLKRLVKNIGLCGLIILSGSVMGQEEDNTPRIADQNDIFSMGLEELLQADVSVGSRTVRNIDESPGAITIITKDKIRELNARTLRDVLNVLVPSFDVVPTYFKYGNMVNAGIYSRGILSDFNQQVLILYNGENKFNESSFGSPYTIMEQTLENVERIEINSSPSPLLGGSALTTINIVTAEQFLEKLEAFGNVGFNTDEGLQSNKFTVNWGKTINSWHVGSSIQAYKDIGQRHPNVGEFDSTQNVKNFLKDGTKFAYNASLDIKAPNDKIQLSVMYKSVTRDSYFSSLSVSQHNDLYDYNTNTLHSFIKIKPIENFDISAGYSSYDFNNNFNLFELLPFGVNQSQNIPFGIAIKNFDLYLQANYVKDWTFAGEHVSWAGFRVENEGQHAHQSFELRNNTFIDVTKEREDQLGIFLPDLSRNVFSVFAEDNWKFTPKLSALLGFRYDYYNNYNDINISAFNPRVALAYRPTDHLIVKGLFSSAVRPPSIYELQGTKFLPLLYGNDNVSFETLNSFEVSAIFKNKKIRAQLTPFYEQFKNRITYVDSPIDNTIRVAGNSGETQVVGIEFAFDYTFQEKNNIFLNVSKLDSKDITNDLPTYFIPDLYINGGFNITVEKFAFNTSFYYRGERELPAELPINSARASGSHFNLNQSINYHSSEKIRIYLLIENLTDANNFVPLSRDGLYFPIRGTVINLGTMIKF